MRGQGSGDFMEKHPYSGSHISSLARADVRVRVRPGVIRVRISETALRAVIRVAAPKQQLIPLYLPVAPVGFRSAHVPFSELRTLERSGEATGF